MKRVLLAAVLAFGIPAVRAEVKVASAFADHMVLQRETEAPVWGWASPGEKVDVSASWGKSGKCVAGADGAWSVKVQTPQAGGPFTLSIRGQKNNVELSDILIGEVWLCSGQSNMGMTVSSVKDAEQEIAAADHPNLRLLSVNLVTAQEPQKGCGVRKWEACSPKNVGSFSAAAYFFGRALERELKVPVGLINSSWGGTVIEAWTPWDSQKDDPYVVNLRASWEQRDKTYDPEAAKKQYEIDKAAFLEWVKGGKQGKELRSPRPPVQPRKDQNYPSNLYNAMIHPLVPFSIRGAIWYQGEGNAGNGKGYRVQLERMITSWRNLWGIEFPFYFVQLPNFKEPWQSPFEDGGWPDIRESFAKTAKEVPNTGMAITIDIGEEKDIHPKNKQDVGERLALVALHSTYKKTGFAWSGPVAKSCEFRDGAARVTFDTGGAPLAVLGGGELAGFALVGAEGNIVRASAAIEGTDTVVVRSKEVKQPVLVAYAWANNPVGVNLGNSAKLPASPFRFGTMPKFEVFAKYLPEEAAKYSLVYAFDPTTSRTTDGNTRFVYEEDHSKEVKGPFKKLAYFLALRDKAGKESYAFVSMDPFTDDVTKIGVPVVASGARFQTKVTGAAVKSNVSGVTNGSFPEGCNIEFCGCNFGPQNASKMPNASDAVFDWGDVLGPQQAPGYGCMQIHNWQEKQCVICFNKFGAGKGNDVGIGNCEGKTLDWTFTSSAQGFTSGEFKVLVLK